MSGLFGSLHIKQLQINILRKVILHFAIQCMPVQYFVAALIRIRDQ